MDKSKSKFNPELKNLGSLFEMYNTVSKENKKVFLTKIFQDFGFLEPYEEIDICSICDELSKNIYTCHGVYSESSLNDEGEITDPNFDFIHDNRVDFLNESCPNGKKICSKCRENNNSNVYSLDRHYFEWGTGEWDLRYKPRWYCKDCIKTWEIWSCKGCKHKFYWGAPDFPFCSDCTIYCKDCEKELWKEDEDKYGYVWREGNRTDKRPVCNDCIEKYSSEEGN